ncbi:mitochondrial intermediate peptidase mitochondrial isoform X4 [Tripterygium wilfordii]|uniref:Mitochondrial intermediate peptidase mitochondrial isoform X4 n=1 Tax=Tripterygium wilfordii TaxID=458696 RepID=A0A7J7DBA6_TRIWF|nr:mitochondrial intermediate peptidase mitochondrial isoform X4 [Tripterygium wilfordii]
MMGVSSSGPGKSSSSSSYSSSSSGSSSLSSMSWSHPSAHGGAGLEVCSVVDSAEFCRNTHPDREFITEACKASMRMNEYMHYLNTNNSLYDAVKKAEQDSHLLTVEARRAAHSLRIDFEKGGIHLCAEKLDRVNQLNVAIFKLSREFGENITTDPGHVDVFPASRIPKNLHHLIKPIYRCTSATLKGSLKQSSSKEKGFQITTEPRTLSSILQCVPDEEVRKMVYVQGNSVPHANIEVLDKLIASRHELAQIVSSYFPLPQCIEGLKVLVESLFGAAFLCIPMAPGESWHPDVLKMSLHHPDEKIILSIVMELLMYYAWDYRVLKRFGRHYSTGEIIPEKLVKSMLGARDMFAATELQRQIFYALVDQTLFGEQPPSPRDTSSIVAELKRQHTSWKHVEGTRWQIRFSHLINYGAGYYSYLYAKCFAANIWQKLCLEDPLSLATGNALRTKFLMHGGAKEPADLLNDLATDGIVRYSKGGIIPDITNYLDELKILEDRQEPLKYEIQ